MSNTESQSFYYRAAQPSDDCPGWMLVGEELATYLWMAHEADESNDNDAERAVLFRNAVAAHDRDFEALDKTCGQIKTMLPRIFNVTGCTIDTRCYYVSNDGSGLVTERVTVTQLCTTILAGLPMSHVETDDGFPLQVFNNMLFENKATADEFIESLMLPSKQEGGI